MNFAVGEQLELVDDAYIVLGWQAVVKETARPVNKVASTSKHPQVPDAILWAVRRAKKVWSKDLTIVNSLTLRPTIKELTHHAGGLDLFKLVLCIR